MVIDPEPNLIKLQQGQSKGTINFQTPIMESPLLVAEGEVNTGGRLSLPKIENGASASASMHSPKSSHHPMTGFNISNPQLKVLE